MAYGAPYPYSSQGYKASDLVLNGSLVLQLVEGFNPTAVDLFLLLFNATAVPPAGTVPKFPISMPAKSSYSWGPIDLSTANIEGRSFPLGCSYAVSSTGNLYTVSANPIWVDITARRTS